VYLKWLIYSFVIAVMLRVGLGTLGIISVPPMGGGQEDPIPGQSEPKPRFMLAQKYAILKKGKKLQELN